MANIDDNSEMIDNIKKFFVLWMLQNMTCGSKSNEWTKALQDRTKFYYDKLNENGEIRIEFQEHFVGRDPVVYLIKNPKKRFITDMFRLEVEKIYGNLNNFKIADIKNY